jgi:RNA polymerase sigma-70 factor (family 1)
MTAYSGFSDIELSTLLKEGDQAAFTEIFDRYNGALYIHAYRRLQDREECRDMVQELLTTLWQKRNEIYLTGTLSSYLYTAIRNKIFNLLSKKKLSREYVSAIQNLADALSFSTDHLTRQNQLAKIIEQEIAALPPRTKEIFELSRKGFMSHREIAEQLNISEQTVKTTVNNALKILRVKLGSLFFIVM